MPDFETGVTSYINCTANIRVHFPVDKRGNAAINCKQCPYLFSNERMCQLNKQPVEYPSQYVGSNCPLKKEE